MKNIQIDGPANSPVLGFDNFGDYLSYLAETIGFDHFPAMSRLARNAGKIYTSAGGSQDDQGYHIAIITALKEYADSVPSKPVSEPLPCAAGD